MSGDDASEPVSVRLVFQLARADNHRLYDELMRFPRGPRRVNRLRTLAYDGLIAQMGALGMARAQQAAPSTVLQPDSGAQVTNAVFGPGLSE